MKEKKKSLLRNYRSILLKLILFSPLTLSLVLINLLLRPGEAERNREKERLKETNNNYGCNCRENFKRRKARILGFGSMFRVPRQIFQIGIRGFEGGAVYNAYRRALMPQSLLLLTLTSWWKKQRKGKRKGGKGWKPGGWRSTRWMLIFGTFAVKIIYYQLRRVDIFLNKPTPFPTFHYCPIIYLMPTNCFKKPSFNY